MNQTYLQSLRKAKQIFKKSKVSSPGVNAELLLSHVVKKPKVELYLNGNQFLTKNQEQKYKKLIQERVRGKPLQYILGETEFYGLKLKVDKNVLIPRPETEILVENVINFFKDRSEKLQIVDWGAGSGNIAIALAKNLNCFVYALDVSQPALKLARKNALSNKIAKKIKFLRSDGFKKLDKKLEGKIDAIVSNPPYVRKSDFKTLPQEIKKFEPKVALLSKKNGLFYLQQIIEQGKHFLSKGGLITLEVALGQAKKVVKLIERADNFEKIQIKKDLAGIERVVLAQRKKS
ncbi:MAG: Release factor glutamine methyltransferase [candidate division Zixibacteria bacterium RBG-1]|nr:MAG: Release factor glutamine methyltransferase [candidate division Zixibacteria bacterium RBG-1]